MKHTRIALLSILTSALLAACGGGDDVAIPGSGAPSGAPTSKGSFVSLVTFGDSLSDQGTYSPATSLAGTGLPPYFGGKFTTNIDGNVSTIWVENLATSLGMMVFPASMGYAGSVTPCPAKLVNPAAAALCTSYGQGGARVTDPNGIGHSGGALTVPVVTQIANHLAAFGGKFKDSDLVLVWAGNNDVLVQFETFAATATAITADAAAGKITPDQAKKLIYDEQTKAQAALKQAATELSSYVRDQILAKGGKYVALVTVPDIGDTPLGGSLTADVRGVLTALCDTFNLWLREGVTGQPVQWIDSGALFKDVKANPAKYGFSMTAVPTCDADKINLITGGVVKTGSSLACNATAGMPYNGMRTGADAYTWAFADSVHPTTGGHKALSDYITTQLRAFGWI